MPTFKKPTIEDGVQEQLNRVLREVPDHQKIVLSAVRIDLLLAFADRDEKTGEPTNWAMTQHGVQAFAITKKIGLDNRVKGMGDVEIRIDGDWWGNATDEAQRALLDHELTHIAVRGKTDDIGRPLILLRPHDFEFGWFTAVAQRNGSHSQECYQARMIMDEKGKAYWPDLFERLAEMREQDQSRVARLEVAAP